jgi:hypothetical protein
MNLRTRLSRSNGYRLLGMYDESILILGDIPLGDMEEAKNLVRRVFKLNGSFKADFLDDPAFDSFWESF